MSLSWQRFDQLVKLAIERKKESSRDSLIEAAYGAWLAGAGPREKSFKTYLVKLGLIEEAIFPADRQREKITAIADASRIIELDRRRKGGEGQC